MPPVDINYIAVLVAAIVNMALGSFWFSTKGFGKQWMALSGMSPDRIDASKAKGMQKTYAIAFVGAFIMAYVLAHFVDYAGAATLSQGAQAGFWTWLGFVAPVMLGMVLWEGKPWKLYVINTSYYLVLLLVNGALLAVWS